MEKEFKHSDTIKYGTKIIRNSNNKFSSSKSQNIRLYISLGDYDNASLMSLNPSLLKKNVWYLDLDPNKTYDLSFDFDFFDPFDYGLKPWNATVSKWGFYDAKNNKFYNEEDDRDVEKVKEAYQLNIYKEGKFIKTQYKLI